MHQDLERSLSRNRVLVSAEIDTGPVHDHPDLPQVGLRVFGDPAFHLPHTTWWNCLHRCKWLERVCVISLGLGTFLYLLKRLCKGIGILRTGRVVPSLPKCHNSIPNRHRAFKRDTLVTCDQHLGVLSQQELGCPSAELHFLHDRQHFLLGTTHVDRQFFWFHLDL